MKKTSTLILILATTLGTYLNGSTLDAADNPKTSVFKHLKKGQIVTLKDNGHNYSIQVLPNTFYIPVTSIKAISFLNGKFGIEK
jgi:hypothetical protein